MILAAEYSRTLRKWTFNTMRDQSATTVVENSAYRRTGLGIYKDSAKRKKLDASLLPAEEDMQLDDHDHHEEEDKGDITPRELVLNGSVDEEDELTESPFEQHELGLQTMEVSIKHIRQKLDLFTRQVSGLLEAGRSFFIDAAAAFEERIVQLHRNQMEKWEQEIELLRAMDAINEDMSFRLADARATISLVRPGPQIQASS